MLIKYALSLTPKLKRFQSFSGIIPESFRKRPETDRKKRKLFPKKKRIFYVLRSEKLDQQFKKQGKEYFS